MTPVTWLTVSYVQMPGQETRLESVPVLIKIKENKSYKFIEKREKQMKRTEKQG